MPLPLWDLRAPDPAPSSSSGSRALRKLCQAGGTRTRVSVAMATQETRAAWSIWKESPYYGEFKGKVLQNAGRLGRVIRLAALRVNVWLHGVLLARLASR